MNNQEIGKIMKIKLDDALSEYPALFRESEEHPTGASG